MSNLEKTNPGAEESEESLDFIREIVTTDLSEGKHRQIITRFPPEPNGYLHIGHAKSICLNFGIGAEFPDARAHLRFDDTNPAAEEMEYVESIQADVKWLGFEWGEHLHFSSDYFDRLYDFAIQLIKEGKAFVCELSVDEFKTHRGAPTEPGKDSPFRSRSIQENLTEFERMKNGEIEEGKAVLRARIDMTSANLHMRDPAIYRIKKANHHRTGGKWCIYPMYDFTHCLSDMIEGITHSLCTLEFEVHRPLYDWVLNELKTPCHPRQIEFARLNLNYTILSKRKLLQLVKENHVSGWDDPRMPTVSGLRRRGYTSEAIRNFCKRIGVTKYDSITDVALLEHSLREDLNQVALRASAVLNPLKVVIENFPEGKVEELDAVNNPNDESAGKRKVPFSREIYVERDDFMEEPPKKFFRLGPDREVRLRFAYFIKCHEIIKNDEGEVVELRCTYDPETLGGKAPDGRKVKGTIHWVSVEHAVDAEIRLYDRLFNVENPNNVEEGETFLKHLNTESLQVISNAKLERSLGEVEAGQPYQFERVGYFTADLRDHSKENPVFNRTVALRDSWAKKK
ncbi:glutamine--tRNA ligase/YqeY domain fusion protein [Verrucomicrobia bacterium]|nr:glutamine--tRNA ligase/YqeY domain fusion protein [Verrucomicrobiota bacterium]MDB4458944.1 glutamine--tRNA ligase/YqeY domain fusion protein [bacterium]